MRKVHFIAVLAAGVAALAAATAATSGSPGFKTSQGAMIDPVAPGASYEAIISVGDTLEDGYMFESIPDGISIATNGKGTVDLYVNHETSTVPFPYTFNQATGTGSGFNDFTNSLVSKLRLHQKSGGVLQRLVRDQLGPQLPALLLELPRHRGARLRPAAAAHERGGHRLGQQERHRVAGDDRRAGSASDRRRGRDRRAERQGQADLGHGPPQPREQRRHPGLRQAGRALGRRQLRQQPGPGTAVLVHRRRLRRGLERRGRPLGVRGRRRRRLLRLRRSARR